MSSSSSQTISTEQTDDDKITRSLKGHVATIVALVALLMSLFHIYTSAFGPFPNMIHRSIHLGFALVLCFSLYGAFKGKAKRNLPTIVDYLWIVLSLIGCIYIIISYDRIMLNPASSTTLDQIVGVSLILVVLESSRRTLGPALPLLALFFILYAYFGNYIPGDWGHRGFSAPYIIETLFMTTQGIWGLVLDISATMVSIFVIFGAILLGTGGGDIFFNVAMKLSGKSYGGPAKVANISSAFFGTLTGSAVANVASTGTFTIPLMKRLGYNKNFAAAVEATASSGGQIAPPIMGAGAFILAENLGMPYITIAAAGTLPALLYFIGLQSAIHFEAKKSNLNPVPDDLIPAWKDVINWKTFSLILAIVVLVGFMIFGFTPATAAFWGIAILLVGYICNFRNKKDIKNGIVNISQSLVKAGKSLTLIAPLCACAQIIVAIISLTGFGVKISDFMIDISNGSLFLTLILAMLSSIILGMGVPTTAAYVLTAAVISPALTSLDILPIAAHFFLFYFAIISGLTPPVCTAVFVASAMAGGNWIQTAIISVRMSFVTYVLPYIFIFSPAILLVESKTSTIIITTLTACMGAILISAGTMGYFIRNNFWWENIIFVTAAILIIIPGISTDIYGIIIASILISFQYFSIKK